MFADKNRHRLAQIAIGVVILLAILPYFRPVAPLIIEEIVGDSSVYIEADYSWMLFEGRCMDVRWELEGIAGVYVQDLQPERGTVGIGELRDCYAPAFSLRVIFPDETTTIYPLDVQYGYQQTHWLVYYATLIVIGLAATSTVFYQEAPPVDMRIRLLKGIMIGCLPLLVLAGMLETRTTHNGGICDKTLSFSDEIFYWAQAATFAEVGFNGGYYTVNERTPPLEQSPFYSWGWGPPVLYGTVASIVPWNYCTPILFNAFLLGIAVISFTAFVPLKRLQLAWLAILLATFPSLVLYMPTFMMQVPNLGLALILTVLFYRAFTGETPLTKKQVIYVLLGITIASIFRPTWALLSVPLFMAYAVEAFSWHRLVLSLFLSLACIGILFGVYVLVAAPFPNVFSTNLSLLFVDVFDGLRGFWANFQNNLSLSLRGNITERVMRLLIVLILSYGIVICVRYWLSSDTDTMPQELWFGLLHVFNASSILVFVLISYDVGIWRDFRVYAPHVFLSIALLIAQGKHNTVLVLLVIALSSFSGYQNFYTATLERQFNPDTNSFEQVRAYETQFAEAGVRYDPDTPSRWCNTVLISLNYASVGTVLHGIDDGLGISLIFYRPELGVEDNILAEQPQSAYLLLADNVALPRHITGDLLMTLPAGRLYRNLDAMCPEPTITNPIP